MSLLRFPEPYDFELSTGPLPRVRHRPGEPAGRRRALPRGRRPRGAHRRPSRRRRRRAARRRDAAGRPASCSARRSTCRRSTPGPRRTRCSAPIVDRLRGFRPPLQPDPFEALITSITAQQVSLFAAVAIRNRLVERLGEPVGEAWAFPTRERIAGAGEEELVDVGFTRRKAEYAVGLARSDLDLDGLAELDDDEVRARITALRGLGPWTAEWFLARHLARPHAWPAGDLALRKAAESLYGVAVTELGAAARTRSRTSPRTTS